MTGCLLAKLLGSHCWYFEIEIHNKTHNKGFRVSHVLHSEEIWAHWFQLGILRGPYSTNGRQ